METEVIFRDDNLDCLREFPAECVDLIYLDPPFFSNRHYEVIWGDEAEVRSFDDRWKGGINEYVDWMRHRIGELHRVLKPTGSLYLHCDPTASHYLKVVMDKVFGGERFVNEIIWKRSSAHSDTRQGSKHYGRVTDSILLYAKSEERTWNQQYVPYDEEYIARDYRRVDPDGRRYRISDMSGPGGAAKGNPEYEVMGVTRHWRYSRERMDKLIAEGRVIQTRPGAVPQLKRYLDEMPGVPVQNLWDDIPVINNRSRERLGYPTQKPEALLERIIRTSSNPGDIVLDPFCGCGTTIAVAQQLQRHWIGIDISPQAAAIMKQRVDGYGANAKVVGLPATVEDLKELGPFEFQNWAIEAVNGVHHARKSGDMGIDGYTFLERLPIQIKQSEKVGRPVVDTFQTAIERDGKHMGYIVAFSFSKNAYDEAARSREVGKTPVQLVRVKDLLDLQDLVLAARAARTQPDLSHVAPDLMGLFAGALQSRAKSRPKVSTRDLFASVERERADVEAVS